MAAGRLPAPGTDLGPCAEPCQHVDCAETRRMAESACEDCGKPIGYDVRFYNTGPGLIHASCLEDRLER